MKHDEEALTLLKLFRKSLNRVIRGMEAGMLFDPGAIGSNLLDMGLLRRARDELAIGKAQGKRSKTQFPKQRHSERKG